MRDIIFLENPVIPLRNQVLVEIEDTYDDKMSKGGIIMHNAAHFEAEADHTGHNLSQWIIRFGTVHSMPRKLYKEGYDWAPNPDEISVGDVVYWPIVKFFEYPVIKTDDGRMFLLVNYFDIHMKKVDGEPVPVNGFYLFTEIMTERKVFEHVITESTYLFRIEAIGKEIVYDWEEFNYEHDWEVGDSCRLIVPPFKLEAEISQEFEKQYFLAQKRHILVGFPESSLSGDLE